MREETKAVITTEISTKGINRSGFYTHKQGNPLRPDQTNQEPKALLDAIVEKFMLSQSKINEDVRQTLRNQQSVIQNLERDVGRIAQALTERPPGELLTTILYIFLVVDILFFMLYFGEFLLFMSIFV